MVIEPNNIYLGDAYKLIKDIPDKSVDVCYIDPPYSYDKSFGNRLVEQGKILQDTNNHIKQMSGGIKKSLLDDIIKKLRYIYIFIWCNDQQIWDYMQYFVGEHNCDYKILGYRKTNPLPAYKKRFLDDIEYCLFFVEKGKQKFYGKDTFNNSFKIYEQPINIMDKHKFKHSSIKPYLCVKNHLEKTCKKGMTVLDCFVGSGTVPAACQELELNYIGFEIDEKWYKVAIDRLNHIDQNGNVSLFDI